MLDIPCWMVYCFKIISCCVWQLKVSGHVATTLHKSIVKHIIYTVLKQYFPKLSQNMKKIDISVSFSMCRNLVHTKLWRHSENRNMLLLMSNWNPIENACDVRRRSRKWLRVYLHRNLVLKALKISDVHKMM